MQDCVCVSVTETQTLTLQGSCHTFTLKKPSLQSNDSTLCEGPVSGEEVSVKTLKSFLCIKANIEQVEYEK